MASLDEPEITVADPTELLAGYLDAYRVAVLRKLDGLDESALRRSAVPSGWTPLGLLKHLAYVELRWFRWGFAAERVETPWGDGFGSGGWPLAPDETATDVREFYEHQCTRSRAIAARADPHERAAVGGRFGTQAETPTLAWIQFHVLQEYARHTGHLDIARELIDGTTGE